MTYEVNTDADGEPTEAPIDVLLLTNAEDGMLCVYGNSLEVKAVPIMPGGTELRFNVMARHAERIWVTGNPDDPDKLMYSAPYDPFNWIQNDEEPADGAGDVLHPSWDGDSFVRCARSARSCLHSRNRACGASSAPTRRRTS